MTTTPGSSAAIDAGCTCQRSNWTSVTCADCSGIGERWVVGCGFSVRCPYCGGAGYSRVQSARYLADPACPIHAQKRPDAGQERCDAE